MIFDFCWIAATYQNSTCHPLIAITLCRRSDISFITFLGIKASESRGVRVEQDYEYVRHRSRRQMRKVVKSSNSVFIRCNKVAYGLGKPRFHHPHNDFIPIFGRIYSRETEYFSSSLRFYLHLANYFSFFFFFVPFLNLLPIFRF
jgi:hypothetical protein